MAPMLMEGWGSYGIELSAGADFSAEEKILGFSVEQLRTPFMSAVYPERQFFLRVAIFGYLSWNMLAPPGRRPGPMRTGGITNFVFDWMAVETAGVFSKSHVTDHEKASGF
jgi:hypothetical protein